MRPGKHWAIPMGSKTSHSKAYSLFCIYLKDICLWFVKINLRWDIRPLSCLVSDSNTRNYAKTGHHSNNPLPVYVTEDS